MTGGRLPCLGLIVLSADETLEHEFRQLIPPAAARQHVTRVLSGTELTPDTIAGMGPRLTQAAALLPAAADFEVVAYACTSGTALLGAAHVRALVSAGVRTRHVTDPLTAATAQIAHLGLQRVGLLSPYMPDVAEGVAASFRAAGVGIAAQMSLDEPVEARVARLPPESLAAAARTLAARAPLDGLFMSCTNLNTLALLAPLSAELGVPVMSSNQALAWHMTHIGRIPHS